MMSDMPGEQVPTQGTSASRAYAQQALRALQVTRDALNDEDPAGIDVALRTADVYARLAQAAAAAEIAAVLHAHTTSSVSTQHGSSSSR